MRFLLFEARDNAGDPFPVVVREGDEPPSWPGLVLIKLSEHDRLESLMVEIEARGLRHAAPSDAATPAGSPSGTMPPAGGKRPEPAR
jgi:hypothetical protein